MRELVEYDVFRVWKDIEVGDPVSLSYRPDADAVEVVILKSNDYKQEDPNVKASTVVDIALGTLPPDKCKDIRMFLKMGYSAFEGTVIRKSDLSTYDDMLKIAVYIKKNDSK